ncbi:MAG: hypothetical protein ACXW1Z_20925 [Methylobacter sp.]
MAAQISACLWILRSGSLWRVLLLTRGKWNSIFKRFLCWCANGTWEKFLDHFSEAVDLQDVSMDSSVIKAYARCKGNKQLLRDEALGRSKGGFDCKFHAICDAFA